MDAVEDCFLQHVVAGLVAAGVEHVLAGQVVARDAGVVGGDQEGYALLAIDLHRMRLVLDPQDEGVAGEVDFDRDPALAHGAQQTNSVALVDNVHAMADAVGAGDLDGLADMALQTLRWHHAEGELAGVQGKPHAGMLLLQKGKHAHVQAVVAHRHDPVLGADDVHRHHAAAGVDRSERRVQAGEHLGRLLAADHIGLKAHLEIAVVDAGRGSIDTAQIVGNALGRGLVPGQKFVQGGEGGFYPGRARIGRQIIDCPGERRVVGRGRAVQHGLDVLHVFRDRTDFQLAQSLIVVVVGE